MSKLKKISQVGDVSSARKKERSQRYSAVDPDPEVEPGATLVPGSMEPPEEIGVSLQEK